MFPLPQFLLYPPRFIIRIIVEVLFFIYFLLYQTMTRRGWTPKEDEAVKLLVQKYGTKNWSDVAKQLCSFYKFKERTGKQCRERYHNHLDPKISKRTWTADEQEILFRKHKIYGNKWTSIAEHLSGRTDNTIKNHFYSTIRRSLRRMSKLIGQKNSTRQMKYIKPSTLSKIFAINTKPSTNQEIQDQKKKCEENFAYKELVDFINFECQELTDVILQFSNFKPKGKNCVLPPNQRERFEIVLQKMQKLNQIYQKMRKQQRRITSTFKMSIEDSDSQESSSNEIQSEQQIKTTKLTRSKRQVKPPKKFQEEPSTKKTTRQTKNPILLKKNSQLIKEYEDKSHQLSIYEKYEKMDLQKKESDKEKAVDYSELHFKQNDFEINLKEKEDNENLLAHFILAQTPSMSLPTSFYINTPALQLYQTPPGGISASSRGAGLFSHLQGSWNLKNGELEDMITNLGSQIARNTSENRQKDDGKTVTSNINCSPHSAFKSFQ